MKKQILAMASAALLGGCGPKTEVIQQQQTQRVPTVNEIAGPLDAQAQPNDLVNAYITTGTNPYTEAGITSSVLPFDNFAACLNFASSQNKPPQNYGSSYREITCVRKRDGASYRIVL